MDGGLSDPRFAEVFHHEFEQAKLVKAKPMKSKHLTDEQRKAIRTLFDDCDTVELLNCVAGILLNDITDFSLAEKASKSVLNAARLILTAGREG